MLKLRKNLSGTNAYEEENLGENPRYDRPDWVARRVGDSEMVRTHREFARIFQRDGGGQGQAVDQQGEKESGPEGAPIHARKKFDLGSLAKMEKAAPMGDPMELDSRRVEAGGDGTNSVPLMQNPLFWAAMTGWAAAVLLLVVLLFVLLSSGSTSVSSTP